MNKNIIKQLFEIFITFFKIGSFTFGGGYAIIPLIEREVAHNKGWVSTEDIVDYFAICESIPGVIAVNSATLIGYKTAGKKGALAAAIGVILPAFIIITIVAAFFGRFQDNPVIKAALMGIRAAVAALIGKAALKIVKTSVKDITGVFIAIAVVVLVVFFDIHAILAIIGGAIFGLANYAIRHNKTDRNRKNKINDINNISNTNNTGNISNINKTNKTMKNM